MFIVGTKVQLEITSDADVYYLSNYYTSSILANNSITFNVKGGIGAQISLLSHENTFGAPYYKIVIGGWYNEKSVIYKQNTIVSEDRSPQLNDTHVKSF